MTTNIRDIDYNIRLEFHELENTLLNVNGVAGDSTWKTRVRRNLYPNTSWTLYIFRITLTHCHSSVSKLFLFKWSCFFPVFAMNPKSSKSPMGEIFGHTAKMKLPTIHFYKGTHARGEGGFGHYIGMKMKKRTPYRAQPLEESQMYVWRYSQHPPPTRPRLFTLERQNFQHVMHFEKEGNQSV